MNHAILDEIKRVYSLSDDAAKRIFERISLLCHGIFTVIATTSMNYSDEEIIAMVRESIIG